MPLANTDEKISLKTVKDKTEVAIKNGKEFSLTPAEIELACNALKESKNLNIEDRSILLFALMAKISVAQDLEDQSATSTTQSLRHEVRRKELINELIKKPDPQTDPQIDPKTDLEIMRDMFDSLCNTLFKNEHYELLLSLLEKGMNFALITSDHMVNSLLKFAKSLDQIKKNSEAKPYLLFALKSCEKTKNYSMYVKCILALVKNEQKIFSGIESRNQEYYRYVINLCEEAIQLGEGIQEFDSVIDANILLGEILYAKGDIINAIAAFSCVAALLERGGDGQEAAIWYEYIADTDAADEESFESIVAPQNYLKAGILYFQHQSEDKAAKILQKYNQTDSRKTIFNAAFLALQEILKNKNSIQYQQSFYSACQLIIVKAPTHAALELKMLSEAIKFLINHYGNHLSNIEELQMNSEKLAALAKIPDDPVAAELFYKNEQLEAELHRNFDALSSVSSKLTQHGNTDLKGDASKEILALDDKKFKLLEKEINQKIHKKNSLEVKLREIEGMLPALKEVKKTPDNTGKFYSIALLLAAKLAAISDETLYKLAIAELSAVFKIFLNSKNYDDVQKYSGSINKIYQEFTKIYQEFTQSEKKQNIELREQLTLALNCLFLHAQMLMDHVHDKIEGLKKLQVGLELLDKKDIEHDSDIIIIKSDLLFRIAQNKENDERVYYFEKCLLNYFEIDKFNMAPRQEVLKEYILEYHWSFGKKRYYAKHCLSLVLYLFDRTENYNHENFLNTMQRLIRQSFFDSAKLCHIIAKSLAVFLDHRNPQYLKNQEFLQKKKIDAKDFLKIIDLLTHVKSNSNLSQLLDENSSLEKMLELSGIPLLENSPEKGKIQEDFLGELRFHQDKKIAELKSDNDMLQHDINTTSLTIGYDLHLCYRYAAYLLMELMQGKENQDYLDSIHNKINPVGNHVALSDDDLWKELQSYAKYQLNQAGTFNVGTFFSKLRRPKEINQIFQTLAQYDGNNIVNIVEQLATLYLERKSAPELEESKDHSFG